MERKVMILVLGLLVAGSMIFAAGGTAAPGAAQEEVITYSYFTEGAEVTSDFLVFKEIEKRTGVRLEVMGIPEREKEDKLRLLAATNELPDIINRFERAIVTELALAGHLMKLKEITQKHAPNFWKLVEEYGYDINWYSWYKGDRKGDFWNLPVLLYYSKNTSGAAVGYRVDIFNKHGLKPPANPDEVYAVLKKLKELYPDSIPWSERGMGFYASVFNTMFGVYDQAVWEVAEVTAPWQEAIAFWGKLYQEQLIDQECFTRTRDSDQQLKDQGKVFFFSTYDLSRMKTLLGTTDEDYSKARQSFEAAEAYRKKISEKIDVMPKPVKEGVRRIVAGQVSLSVDGPGLNINIDQPEKACKFFDFIYSLEGQRLAYYGIEGVHYNHPEDDKFEWLELTDEQKKTYGETWRSGGYGGPGLKVFRYYSFLEPFCAPTAYTSGFQFANMTYARLEDIFTYSEDQQKRAGELAAQINPVIEKWRVAFITGQKDPYKDWNAYLEDLNRVGLEEYRQLRKENLADIDFFPDITQGTRPRNFKGISLP